MRSALALLALVVACGPAPAILPCNSARDCPERGACHLGRCAGEPLAPRLYPPGPAPLSPPPAAPLATGYRVSAGLIALLDYDGERSGWGPDLDASLDDEVIALGPRADGCDAFTLEAFTPAPASEVAPLLSLAGVTLTSTPGARHHAFAVDLPLSDDALRVEGNLSLGAVYCRALTPAELSHNAALGPTRPPRVDDGLLARYRFADAGDLIRDEGPGPPTDLTPVGSWARVAGGLRLTAARLEGGFAPALHEALDGALTLELWLEPAASEGAILSDLGDPDDARLELRQRGQQLEVQLGEDLVEVALPSALVHLVVTHDGARIAVYVDGARALERGAAPLSLGPGRFGLGDRPSGGAPWQGALYDLAVFGRALAAAEIAANFAHGPEATESPARF